MTAVAKTAATSSYIAWKRAPCLVTAVTFQHPHQRCVGNGDSENEGPVQKQQRQLSLHEQGTIFSSRRSYHRQADRPGLLLTTSGLGRSPWNCKTLSYRALPAARYLSSSSKGVRDFYDVLGVDKSADKATIKKAYFKLAKQYHPDTNQGDASAAEKFKEVTAAYEILSDDKQREMYDQFGHAGVDPNFQASGNPFEGGFNFQDGSFHFSSNGAVHMDPEELFDMFFGSGNNSSSRRRSRGPRRGADLQMQVRLTFQEAVFGTSKDLHLRYQVVNRQSGEVQFKDRDVTVDIPPGIDTGMNLRLQGQGAEGDPGAPSGNLLVQVVVEPDNYFIRDGFDVHTELPIRFTQAILGGSVDVRTLAGMVEMKIPKGAQPDTKLMLRGKGIQQLNGSGKGNQIVHLKIEIPKEITSRQEELLREFDSESEAQGGHGLTGRLAHAAETAFEKLFGNDKKKKKKNQKNKASSEKDHEDDEDKKEAAQ